jgi:hypothetical protein
LVLSVQSGKSFEGKMPIFRISAAELRSVELAGSGSVRAKGLTGEGISVSVSGSGSLKGDGRIVDLVAVVSGSGDADLSELIAERANATVSGSGSISVNVSEKLTAKVSGSGSIHHRGAATVTQVISGSGTIEAAH